MFDDFYGFESRPFQLTPDPAFYFESRTHRKALSYLGYGLAQGEGFVVITGEVGAGKSTLVAHLMATIDPSRLTAAQVVTSALDGEEIVHVVAQAFGLPVAGHDKASALGAIEGFLHEEARHGRRCLLIVDEAQNLSVSALEELRMLSNFQLGSHPLLQTLLLGQPEFRATLLDSRELEQLRQRVIATHHLEAMQADEVQAYIEHRLGCVGWQGNPQFDAEVFAGIFEATGGVPRRINQLVNRLLLLGAVEQRSVIDFDVLSQVLAELDADGSISLVSRKAPEPEVERKGPAMQVEAAETEGGEREVQVQAEPVQAGIDTEEVAAVIESALADRDAQITELQQAVLELATAAEAREQEAAVASEARVAALETQLQAMTGHVSDLEARLAEHDRMLRHTLTMLIEWIEGGEGQRRAA
ncbi:XrtA/PEP-CTERM system-associated ATPase [Novosphingobium mathurense]|uniref:Putative secretion ATPase, PEP-CTERM locus subfamily n=1 Tax=Novosphingobium mathurense TaxID=428990 RepID=A0A1U6GVL3_9SPHN|nr:XrtA/PEP-CTERM system-associated ATPase [Novosphingobium mathurense]SLJ87557.1 putative secretion ATPase, PEP-CTERM locus subfamily [Novosphingobium mathurense]